MQASGCDFMKAFKCSAKHQLGSQYSHCIANCQPITASVQPPQCSSPLDDALLKIYTFPQECPRTTSSKTFLLNCTSQTLRWKPASGNNKNGRSLASASRQKGIFTRTLSHGQGGEYLKREKIKRRLLVRLKWILFWKISLHLMLKITVISSGNKIVTNPTHLNSLPLKSKHTNTLSSVNLLYGLPVTVEKKELRKSHGFIPPFVLMLLSFYTGNELTNNKLHSLHLMSKCLYGSKITYL